MFLLVLLRVLAPPPLVAKCTLASAGIVLSCSGGDWTIGFWVKLVGEESLAANIENKWEKVEMNLWLRLFIYSLISFLISIYFLPLTRVIRILTLFLCKYANLPHTIILYCSPNTRVPLRPSKQNRFLPSVHLLSKLSPPAAQAMIPTPPPYYKS